MKGTFKVKKYWGVRNPQEIGCNKDFKLEIIIFHKINCNEVYLCKNRLLDFISSCLNIFMLAFSHSVNFDETGSNLQPY